MSKLNETASVLIIGGGVIGLTIARALALRDTTGVMVIEKNRCGQEASWAAGGILAPQVEADKADDFFQLACASRDMYPDFARALQDESGIDVQLDMTGTLYVAFTAEEEQELRSRLTWQQSEGLSVEWLNSADVRRIEPNLANNVRCALRFPNDYQVENRRLIEALSIANQRLGVELIDDCECQSLRTEGGRVCGVETSHGFVGTGVVVLAAGAWTSLINSPDASLPAIAMEPVRGQMLCFKADPPIARHVIYSSRGYLVPRRDGRVLAGSTAERVGFEKSVTGEGMNAIKAMTREIAPSIAGLPLVDSWAGFRPRAADGLPVLGSCAGIKGLFYATGHYRNGILLAPITGELIAKAIVEGETPPLLGAFSPGRFASDA